MTTEDYVVMRLDRGARARRIPTGFMVTCPAHADANPSLHVSEGNDGRILLSCQAGCPITDVLAADGLTFADLFPEGRANGRAEVAQYLYADEKGRALFEVVRFEPKDFRQRLPDGTWKLGNVRRVLFHLPELVAASRDRPVYVAEGEKDVLALERVGALATCNPGGAGKWRDSYSEPLRGREVIVIADRDDAGRKHASQVAASLRRVDARVRIVEPAEGKDASDHLRAGKTLAELVDAASVERAPVGALAWHTANVSRIKRIDWAWAQRLVVGYLNLLVGEESIGKSTFAAWVIARLTLGRLPGDSEGRPVNVGIVGDEDDFDRVWTPRLALAGADLDRVGLLTKPDLAAIEFGRDRERLTDQVRERRLGLLYFDALLDNLGSGDANAAKDVREALRPIRLLAREMSIVTWGSMHPGKSGTTFRELVAGSHQFNAVTRSGFLLAADPEDPERRVLVRGKGNLCPEPPGVEFVIESGVVTTPLGEIEMGVACDVRESRWTRDTLLARNAARRQVDDSDLAFLRNLLEENDGEVKAGDAYEAGQEEGIGRDRMNAAAHALRLERESMKTFPRYVVWRSRARVREGATTETTGDNSDNSGQSSHDNSSQSTQLSKLSLSSGGTRAHAREGTDYLRRRDEMLGERWEDE